MPHRGFQRLMSAVYEAKLFVEEWSGRIAGKVKRLLRMK